MRIAFVTGSIARIGSGRSEAVPLARALTRSGCEVAGLEPTRFRRGRTTVEGLDVHFEPVAPYLASYYLPMTRPLPALDEDSRTRGCRSGLHRVDRATGDALLALGDRLSVDVVYAFHNTNVARLIRGWPHHSRLLAINLIGFGIDPSRGGAADTFPFQNVIFQRPHWDLHIAATKFEYDQYAQVYEQLGISLAKLMHLPHSFDVEVFHPPVSPLREQPRISEAGPVTVLYPVNVYPRKNIELAIDIIARVRRDIDCRLVVTGRIWDDGYHAKMVRRAREQGVGDSVEFLGGVSNEALIELYQRAGVVIYTSHQETFGHGIIEALGCGTPVVGPDWIIPCREILTGSPGCWTARKEPEHFAQAVGQALGRRHDAECIAAQARARYGNAAVAEQFLERCRSIKAAKESYGAALASIDWKGLYRDAGDLL